MSGQEIERENILGDAPSVASRSKPTEPEREHTQREHSWRPEAGGLYDLSLEKDSFGVGFNANIKGKRSHQIVANELNILGNCEHRFSGGDGPIAGGVV